MSQETMNQALERIAREELELTTLEPHHDNAEDFHRLAVWEIETVMERAYLAGRAANDGFVRRWFAVGERLPDGSTETIKTSDTLQEALRYAQEGGRPCFIDAWLSDSAVPEEGHDEIDESFRTIHYPF